MTTQLTGLARRRVLHDIKGFQEDSPAGIWIDCDDADISKITAHIIGPSGTPYAGGFFSFNIQFSNQYPMDPPKATFLTKATSGAKIRFNPNLYENGKVCLSILGTWTGPGWSPSMNMLSILLSLQTLLNENPLQNEPGFCLLPGKKPDERYDNYNKIVEHETLRVAVCQFIERLLQKKRRTKAENSILTEFLKNTKAYENLANKYIADDGKIMECRVFGNTKVKISYAAFLKKIKDLEKHVTIVTAPGGTPPENQSKAR